MYTIEEFDKAKTKVLKYVMYKKRTLQEVKNKFISQIEENLLEDVLQELQEIGYISDTQYIQRAVNEYIALKNLSIKEFAARAVLAIDKSKRDVTRIFFIKVQLLKIMIQF